jgi:hypothetical protein
MPPAAPMPTAAPLPTAAAAAAPRATGHATRDVARPQRSGRGVTGRGTVVLIFVVTAIVGLLEVVISGHRGHLFGIAFVATSAIGALVVRRRDVRVAMIAPPILYCFLIVVMAAVDNPIDAGGFITRKSVYVADAFFTGAPAIWAGTAAAALIGWRRLRRRSH